MLVKGAPCVHTVQLLDCGLVFSMGTTNDDSHTANGIFENENIESAMLVFVNKYNNYQLCLYRR